MRLVVAAVVVGILAGPVRAETPRADTCGLSVPRGSRVDSDQVWTSRLGFRKTVKFYEKLFKRHNLEPEVVPVYRYRGVDVARFLARHEGAGWRAVQIFRKRGVTRIAIVPTASASP